MTYKKQGMFELTSKFPFGKHKGKSVAATYSGDASALIRGFIKLLDKSLELMFSKEFYEVSDDADTIDVSGLASGWADDNNRIDLQDVGKLVLAVRDGLKIIYKITTRKIKVKAIRIDGEVDVGLSIIACDMAKEYVTRFFGKISVYGEGNFFRPALLTSPELGAVEEEISKVEGQPDYIYWCIRKVDGLCFRGNEKAIESLDRLPVFSLDSLIIDAGKTKNNSFKIGFLLRPEFAKAGRELVSLNFGKYLAYLTSDNDRHSSQEYHHDDDDYYDSDDDEDNIMRGLANGDGDNFGF